MSTVNFPAMEVEEGPANVSISPSFSSYSSGSSSIAEIAARVVREIGEESLADSENHGSDYCGNLCNGDAKESVEEVRSGDRSENGDHDDEFEFAVLCRESDASTSSANEIFFNGQIKPVYPVFNTKLLLENSSRVDLESKNPKTKSKPAARRSPLRKLMNEEKRKTTSQSSSEADDLGDIPSDTYCVWSPNTEKTSLGRSNKRNSAGSSNGWKLKDLLYSNNRSKIEGEDAQMMRRTSIKNEDQPGNLLKVKEDPRSAMGVATSAGSRSGFASFPSHNARYGRNRAMKEAEKRKSYLPYRQHLVGCVVDVNATI